MPRNIHKTYFDVLCIFSFTIPFIEFDFPKYIIGFLSLFQLYIIWTDPKEFRKQLFKKKKVLLSLLILPVYFGLTLFYSDNLISGFSTLGRYSFCVLFPLIFIFKRTDKPALKLLSLSYLAGVFGLILVNFILILLKWNEPVFYSYSRFYYQNLSNYVQLHPGYYSLMISIAIFICTLYLKKKQQLVCITILLIPLILLSSKGVTLITFIFLSIVVLKKIHGYKNWLIILVVTASVLIMLPKTYLYERVADTFYSFSDINSIYENKNNRLNENLLRFFLFQYSYKTITKDLETVLFGYGIGDYKEALLKTFEEEKYGYGLHYKYNSHNQYLTTLLMSGIFGLLCFIFYLSMPLVFLEEKSNYYFLLFLFLGYGSIESFFDREIGILLTSYFITIILLLERKKEVECISQYQK